MKEQHDYLNVNHILVLLFFLIIVLLQLSMHHIHYIHLCIKHHESCFHPYIILQEQKCTKLNVNPKYMKT